MIATIGANERASADDNLKTIFVEPSCAEHLYDKPIPTFSGATATGKARDSYCTESDYSDTSVSQSPTFVELSKFVNDKRFDHFIAYYFIFSEPDVVDIICSRNKAAPITMDLTVQQSSFEETDSAEPRGISPTDSNIQRLQQCMGNALKVRWVGCAWFAPNAKCPRSEIATMHLKFWKFQGTGLSDVVYVFGSGNIGQSLYANFDNWAFYSTNAGSAVDRQLGCLTDPIAQTDPVTENGVTDAYFRCLKAKNVYSADYPVSSFLMPATHLNFLLSTLTKKLAPFDDIYLTTQDIGGKQIHDFLVGLANQGKRINIVLDDDFHWARYGISVGVARATKAKWVEGLVHDGGGRITVRYLETNHHSSFKPSLHDKLLAATNSRNESFAVVSTANWDDGSLRSNLETVHLVNASSWASFYLVELERLWAKSFADDELPIVDVAPKG